MKWSNMYRFVSYARGSLWIIPSFAIATELDLLDRMVQTVYVLPEDLALARVPDAQAWEA
jgi:hypothetical protein